MTRNGRVTSTAIGPALVLTLAACQANLRVPSDIVLACTQTSDCPSPEVCNQGVCVPPSQGNEPAPALTQAPAVTPAVGTTGTKFQILLSVNEALLAVPTVTLELATPIPVTCAGTDTTHFTCSYTATGMENGGLGGTIPFNVSMVNTVKIPFTAVSAGSITIDPVVPQATASGITIVPAAALPGGGSAPPAVAGLGATISVWLTASKPLASPPMLSVSPALSPSISSVQMTQVGTSLTYNFSHMVMAEDPASATFTATLTDLVGNTKTVSIGTVTIDPVPLTLSNLTVTNGGSPAAGSPPRFSGVSGYNTVQVSFTSSKVLGSGLVAAITEGVPVPFTGDAGVGADGGTGTANGSLPLSCVASAGDAGATYICRYSVTGHETTPDGTPISTVAEETEQVVINAVDDVGNVATLGAPLVFDFQAPQLDQSTVAIDYIPAFPVNSVLQAVTAAGPNSTVVISASANEPLSGTSTPSVSLSPVPSAFPQFNSLPSANANSFTFEATIGTNTTGTYQVAITNLVDLVGNTTAAAQMNTALLIQNDSTTPPAGLDANNTITQVRAPWGSLSSFGMPYSALMGSPDTNNQSKTIAVFSGPGAPGSAPSESNPVAAQLVAIITANPDGSFGPFMSNGSTTYNLPPIDYPVLYVAAVNAAGVPSARQEVMSVSWYGNLWNSGSSTNNSTLVKVPSFSPTLVPNPQDAFPASAAQMAQLQPSGGTPSTIAAAGVWAQRAANASSPGARSGAAYAFDTRRGVGVLFGGTDGTSSFGDTWEWDGSAWTQKTVQGPSPRAGAAMAFDPLVGAVVLFGGFNGNSYLADTWQWDGSTWKNLTPTGLSPTARWNAAMTWDGSLGAVVLFGGDSGNQLNHDLMLWNGSAWSMALGCTGNVFPSARSLHTLSWLPQQNVLVVVGGRDGTGDQGDTWTCTGATASTWNKQVSLTNLPSREGAVAGVTPNGLIVFGGLSGTTALSDAWIWNGTGSSWTSLASAPAALSARTQAAGGWDSVRNELDVIGGTGGTGSYCKAGRHCADNWGFSPSTSTWADETPQPLPPALSGAAAAYDSAHGQTVIFGGLDANGNPSSQTLLWDGHHWLQPEPQTTPPARSGAAMAYDANAGVAVLFGGVDDTGTAMGDTWLWDGTNWSSGSGGTPPAARSGHVMVYDSRAQNVIMFGGSSGSSNLLDTEIWTPSGWQQEFPQQFPPLGRVQAGAAFDQGSSNTVVFGGELMAGSPLNTTYLWNGGAQTWTFDSGAVGGPLRSGQVMAYDSARNHVVLFGGMGSSGLMNDIWDLDDGSPDMWIPRTPVQAPGGAAPSPRMGAVGVFDSARNRFVVFGGTTSGGQVLGDVWELSNLPSTQPAEIASLTFAATGDLNNVAASGFGWQLSAFIGGTGANTNGAFAQAWNPSAGSWSALSGATTTASQTTPAKITASGNSQSGILGADGQLHFAFLPSVAQGSNDAQPSVIAVGYVEVLVRYTKVK